MSDQTIPQLCLSSKDFYNRLSKLNQLADELDILIHQQKRFSREWEGLTLYPMLFVKGMDELAMLVFLVRQEIRQLSAMEGDQFRNLGPGH
jgi:hypothetical protein